MSINTISGVARKSALSRRFKRLFEFARDPLLLRLRGEQGAPEEEEEEEAWWGGP